jgi:hypothetical protein
MLCNRIYLSAIVLSSFLCSQLAKELELLSSATNYSPCKQEQNIAEIGGGELNITDN